jgi:hypothetical protein
MCFPQISENTLVEGQDSRFVKSAGRFAGRGIFAFRFTFVLGNIFAAHQMPKFTPVTTSGIPAGRNGELWGARWRAGDYTHTAASCGNAEMLSGSPPLRPTRESGVRRTVAGEEPLRPVPPRFVSRLRLPFQALKTAVRPSPAVSPFAAG